MAQLADVRRLPQIGMALHMIGAIALVACASEPKPASALVPTPIAVTPIPCVAASTSSAPVAVPDPAEDEVRGGPSIKARDPRWEIRGPRSRAVMLTEVQRVERLLAEKPTSAPRLALLLRRAAEIYAELARTVDGTARADARRKAIDAYEAILRDHQATYDAIDEVRYYLGLEYELAGDLFKARATHDVLIKTDPASRFVPFVYFSSGENYFSEGAADPRTNALAAQAYADVLKYPPSRNRLYVEALLRLAQTYDRMGNRVKAKAFLDQLVHDFPDSDPAQRATKL